MFLSRLANKLYICAPIVKLTCFLSFPNNNSHKLTNALGRHILVEFFDCDATILNDTYLIETAMLQAAALAKATIINSNFHHFSPFGVSGVVVVQESHLAIHTWPEYSYAAVDIFTCGDTISPWVAYRHLQTAFKAANGSAIELNRGQIELMKPHNVNFLQPAASSNPNSNQAPATIQPSSYKTATADFWFEDRVDNMGLSIRCRELLFCQQSPFQLVQVFDTYNFGRMLTIDTIVMCTEKDEFIYHEMITHPAMLLHPNPQNILVIGGGDGGTVRELLRHDSLQQITMVEIDAVVVDACRQFLPQISQQLDNPKLNLIIGDGIEWVQNAAAESYDVIIIDGSDPVGPAEGLFSTAFFQNVYKCLRPDGILATQTESPTCNAAAFKELNHCFKAIFGAQNTRCYLAPIPTYPSGLWSFHIVGKNKLAPTLNPAKAAAFVAQQKLKYYNPDIHPAAFALPNYVKDMLR